MKNTAFLLALTLGLSAFNLSAQSNDKTDDRPSRQDRREKNRMENRARPDRQAPAQQKPQMRQAPDQPMCPVYGWPRGQGRRLGAVAPNAQGPRPQGSGPGFAPSRGGNWAPSYCPNCGCGMGGPGRQAMMGRGQGFGQGQGFGRGASQAFAPRFNGPQNARPMGRGPAFAPQSNNPKPQAPEQNFNGPMRHGRGGPGAGAPFNRPGPGPRFQNQDSSANPKNQ